jgi:hypothetical protein
MEQSDESRQVRSEVIPAHGSCHLMEDQRQRAIVAFFYLFMSNIILFAGSLPDLLWRRGSPGS